MPSHMAMHPAAKWARNLTLGLIALLAFAVVGRHLLISLIWRPVSEGTPFDVERARGIVAEQPALLAAIMSLRSCPEDEAKRRECAALAAQIGALGIRTERSEEGGTVAVCFERHGGAGETYSRELQWLPPALAADIRAGRSGLGDYWQELSGGWFWVCR